MTLQLQNVSPNRNTANKVVLLYHPDIHYISRQGALSRTANRGKNLHFMHFLYWQVKSPNTFLIILFRVVKTYGRVKFSEVSCHQKWSSFLNSSPMQFKSRQYSTPLRLTSLLWQAWEYCTTCTASGSLSVSVCLSVPLRYGKFSSVQLWAWATAWLPDGLTEAAILFLNNCTIASQ